MSIEIIGFKDNKELKVCDECDSIMKYDLSDIKWEIPTERRLCDNGYLICPCCENKQWTMRR